MDSDAMQAYRPGGYARGTDAADTSALLPGLTTDYKAAGNPENHEISRLVLIMGASGFKPGGSAYIFLQYVHISMGEFGFMPDGQVFNFVFSDIRPKLVTVHGRNLLRICDYIALRRMPWIRMKDRDFKLVDAALADEPIITRIEVTDWKRPKGLAADAALGMDAPEGED